MTQTEIRAALCSSPGLVAIHLERQPPLMLVARVLRLFCGQAHVLWPGAPGEPRFYVWLGNVTRVEPWGETDFGQRCSPGARGSPYWSGEARDRRSVSGMSADRRSAGVGGQP